MEQEFNQLENQDENTYISISISKYLSNISKSVLNLLYKTIVCKNYNKNWGGKRKGAGKPIKEEPQTPKKYQDENQDEENNINKENFEKFWALCPKQTDEYKSFGVYVNIISDGIATYEEIENGMRAYSEYVKNNEIKPQYISSPLNWLSGQKWKDNWNIKDYSKMDILEKLEEYRRQNGQETIY